MYQTKQIQTLFDTRIIMKNSRVDLKLSLKPETEELYASAFLDIHNPGKTIEFMLNNKLELLEVSSEVKLKRTEFNVKQTKVSEDCFLKNCRKNSPFPTRMY